MGIAAAIGGAAVVASTGTSLLASSKAASTAKSTASANNALQQSIYNYNSAALSPYENLGQSADQALSRLLGIGDTSAKTEADVQSQQAAQLNAFQTSAPYQAELKTGQDAVTAELGSKGLLDSGAAQKSLLSYGDNFLSGQLNTYEGQLAALGGQGLTATSAQAGVGQNYANSVSANNNAASTTTGNAALSSANSVNSALGNALTAYSFDQGLGSSYSGAGTSANDYNLIGSGAAALGGG